MVAVEVVGVVVVVVAAVAESTVSLPKTVAVAPFPCCGAPSAAVPGGGVVNQFPSFPCWPVTAVPSCCCPAFPSGYSAAAFPCFLPRPSSVLVVAVAFPSAAAGLACSSAFGLAAASFQIAAAAVAVGNSCCFP